MNHAFKTYFLSCKSFLNLRLFFLFILGFSSGMPLFLTGSTLQTWYADAGINIIAIGCLSLVGQPYIYKFLWAPLMDRYSLPFIGLGRRRSWILVTQIGCVGLLILMAAMDPALHPYRTAIIAFVIAFFSASQDISVDAYRAEILHQEELGLGVAVSVAGYRLAMLFSGGLALIFAAEIGWHLAYLCMAFLMSLGILGTLFAPPPLQKTQPPAKLSAAILDPLKEFLSRSHAVTLLLFLFFYKISFEFSLILTPTFLYRDLGFSLIQLGTINKGLGLGATLAGIFLGGFLLKGIGLFRSLFYFGLLHGLSILGYMALAIVGKVYVLMVAAVTIENFFAGMETAAFVGFIMSLCNKSYTATQFALFSALGTASRIIAGPIAGLVVAKSGWVTFYLATCLAVFPALILLVFYRQEFISYPTQPILSET